MKRILILTLAALLLLSACGGKESPASAPTAPADAGSEPAPAAEPQGIDASETAAEIGGYTCVFDNGMTVTLGAAADEQLPALGEPTEQREAPSCLTDGMDVERVYAGGAFSVIVSEDKNGVGFVSEVLLLSDALFLAAGDVKLTIGSPASLLDEAFGEPASNEFGVRRYELDGGLLSAAVPGDSIASLSISCVPAN